MTGEGTISVELVRQLREKTGAPMMECKKALTEARGDLSEAEVVLRKRGIATAQRKAGRTAVEGLVASLVPPDGALGALVEINCESDFVARTEDFQGLAKALAQQIANENPSGVTALLARPFLSDCGQTVEQAVFAQVAKLGENIVIRRFTRYQLQGPGRVGSYLHHGKIGVLVEVACGPQPGEGLRDVVKDVAMHVAASDPRFLSREDVDPDVLRQEREIQRERARAEGKPEKVLDKIVEGRLGKFYEEVCLLEQPFIRDLNLSVGQWLRSKAPELGPLTVRRFARFKVGEGVVKE